MVVVLGATGATGRLLLSQLLEDNIEVKAVVRDVDRIPKNLLTHPKLHIIVDNVLTMEKVELAALLDDCQAVFSCLGSNLSFSGLFAPPYRLVTNSLKRIRTQLAHMGKLNKVKIILMNSSGVRDVSQNEKISPSHKLVVSILRVLLPPHADNEQASKFLFKQNKKQQGAKWVAVRPDALVDEQQVSEYQLSATHQRNPIFDAGKTSRVNVANFMKRLYTEDKLWDQWQGKMPIIYNQ